MPGANVSWPIPLVRLNPWFSGQMGVPGTDSETGLRTDTHGTVFYVDPNAVGVSDQRDGTDPNEPLQTVATAITKCQPYRGDVIAVMANNSWQYGNSADLRTTAIVEEVTLDVPGVRLVGIASAGQGVYWQPASNGGTCITVHAIDCTIEGFFFSDGPDYAGCNAISAEWDGTTLFGENLTVRHCVFDDTVDIAVQLEYAWYCEVYDCWFLECDEYGIYTAATGSGTDYTAIHDNLFIDIGTGAIALLGDAGNNHIYRNRIFNQSAEGGIAATNEGINTTGGTTNFVTENWLSCLLPVPANGDLNDFCSAAATDAWAGNYCLDGLQVTKPT
jgi:hypothetical protein